MSQSPTPTIFFTQRELEIISLIKEGFTSHEIAEKLFVTESTVKTHRRNILKKKGIKGKAAFLQFVYTFNTHFDNA